MIRLFIALSCLLICGTEICANALDSTAAIETTRTKALELIRSQHFTEALSLVEQGVISYPRHAGAHIALAQIYLAAKGRKEVLFDSAGFKAQRAIVEALKCTDTNNVVDELINWTLTDPNTACQMSVHIGKLFHAMDMPMVATTFLNSALTDCPSDSNAAYGRYLLAQCLLNTTWQKPSSHANTTHLIRSTEVLRNNLFTALRLLNEGMAINTTATYFYGLLGDIHTELAMLGDSNKTQHEAIAISAYKSAIIAAINRKATLGFKEDTAKTDGKLHRTARFDDFAIQDTEPNVDIRVLSRKIAYPTQAKNMGMVGKIMTMVYVNRYGDIRAIIVYTKDAEPFEPTITNAVMSTPFTPAKEGRIPVGSLVTIPFIFRIR